MFGKKDHGNETDSLGIGNECPYVSIAVCIWTYIHVPTLNNAPLNGSSPVSAK